MDVKSGYPWWAIKNGLLHAFPRLQQNARCEVAVLGGGISGALIAHELVQHGHDVVVIEQREVGWGSTAASTALLQYEIDTPMTALAKRYGEANALLAYRACIKAIAMLHTLAAEVKSVDFASMESVYYASKRGHASSLRDEYALRAKYGFPVEFLQREALRKRYRIDASCAILSKTAASIDPYRMAYRILMRLEQQGSRVYDCTRVEGIVPARRDVTLHLHNGHRVRAKYLIMAAGYSNQDWLKQRVARNRSSYALVTDPINAATLGPLCHTMLWETARPYLYMRATSDSRLLIGGEDDSVDIPVRRDARVDKKARKLLADVAQLFPHLPLQPAFAWGGTFAETKDGLPFFGSHPEHGPHVLFAMAYGGNGITYSMLGAGLLRALIERREHPLAALFSFARLD